MSYIKDSHGSVIRTADASGNAMQEAEYRADYDAFGNSYQGSRNTPFGYCGEYVDSESGNVYLRNRYYNRSTGRFITEDPAQDGLNWYVYAGNNPVSFVDPLGWITEEEKMMYQRGELSQQAYDILMQMTTLWENANKLDDTASMEEIHNLTQKFRENGYYATDVSYMANQTLWENGQKIDTILDIVYAKMAASMVMGKVNEAAIHMAAGTGIAILSWYNKVDNYGEWDYKVHKTEWMKGNDIFVVNGLLMDAAGFGNVNYGYTGIILGFGPTALYSAGGFVTDEDINAPAPLYGDSYIDHYNIEVGINWAQSQGLNDNKLIADGDVRYILSKLR